MSAEPDLIDDLRFPVGCTLPVGTFDLHTLALGPGKSVVEVAAPMIVLGAVPQVDTNLVQVMDTKAGKPRTVPVRQVGWLVLLAEVHKDEPEPEGGG